MRGRSSLAVAILAAALVAVPAAAAAEAPPWRKDVAAAEQGLAQAEEKGRLTAEEVARYRAALAAASVAIEELAPVRSAAIASIVRDAARASGLYNGPRALTLFAMLEENVEYLSANPLPPAGRDVTGPDGTIYRAFSGSGLQFHPLANGARLNALLAGNRDEEALLLAEAILARSVPNGAGDLYEYWFGFHNVAAPWTSGMAQAVLAQALARAGDRFGDARFTAAARRAFTVIPSSLVIQLDEGPWIRLYSRLGLVVLNAHLQAALSLGDYAGLAGDGEAEAFAAELRATATKLLPRFDTGSWTRYALGDESPLEYQRFVVSLLKRLATATGEPLWRETADRFERYELEEPLVELGPPPVPLYPVPADGHRDVAEIRLWVSKIGTARLSAAGGTSRFGVRRGWNTLALRPPKAAAPGTHEVELTVTDLAGNETVVDAPAIEIRRDTDPPDVFAARVRGRTFTWRVTDEGTTRVRLVIGPSARKPLDLGWQPLAGSRRLPGAVPAHSVLRITDTTGNRAHFRLSG